MPGFVTVMRDINDRRGIIRQKRDMIPRSQPPKPFAQFQNGQGAEQAARVYRVLRVHARADTRGFTRCPQGCDNHARDVALGMG